MAGPGGYFASASSDASAGAPPEMYPLAVRALRILLWSETALTAVMLISGLVAAGPSVRLLAQLAVFAWPGAAACAAAVRFTRPRAGHRWTLAAAMAWQLVLAVSELVAGDPRGLTSSVLPAAILILLRTASVRAHYPHHTRRFRSSPHGDETGATFLEYLALGVLAAVILGVLTTLGLPSTLGTATRTTICSVLNENPCPPTTDRPATRAATSNGGTSPGTSGNGRPNGGTPPSGDANRTPPGGTTPGGTTPGATPPGDAPPACHGLLRCAWHALTTDPYDAARRMPCTNLLTCAGHGALLLFSSQWNVDRAFVGDVTGIADLFKPGAMGAAADYAWHHPLTAARQLVWDDDSAKMWHDGNPIGAVSRGIWNVGSWFIPGNQAIKGLSETAKLSRLAHLASKAGDLGRLARAAKDAGKAADRAERLASKGDAKGARAAANEARRKADDAESEARKKGCRFVSLGVLPTHIGGGSAAVMEGGPSCGSAADAERQAERATERVWERAIADPQSLRGMNPEALRDMIPKSWKRMPARKHDGIRYADPKRQGDQVVIEGPIPGYDPPNVHAGKYVKISRSGKVDRVPLEGNPAL